MVMLVCILGGIGTAGVPSGSLPVIAMILSTISAPPSGIGLILGIDRPRHVPDDIERRRRYRRRDGYRARRRTRCSRAVRPL